MLFIRVLCESNRFLDWFQVITSVVAGIYFSAHWCPPCRSFTPKLSVFYEEHRAAGQKFEVVFVSSDKDASSWEEYFHEMPWLALPFNDPKKVIHILILKSFRHEVFYFDGENFTSLPFLPIRHQSTSLFTASI